MHTQLKNCKTIDTINILNINQACAVSSGKTCIVVTGVTGQDGSHMVDYLLKHTDYIILGGVRRLSIYNHTNIKHIQSDRFKLIHFDLTDRYTIANIFEKIKPDYFINFAAQSFVGSSWDFPEQTWNTNATAILNILESMRSYCPKCKLYQAGSSEEFGDVAYSPQDEKHPLKPRSPYGASKVASRMLIKTWRESYNLFAIQGWLFNHEGPRRGEEFITRKITKNVAYINYCMQNNRPIESFNIGNIYAERDWSDSEDFVDGVWKMLTNDTPKEFVFASGIKHTIKDLIDQSFKYIKIDVFWENETDDVLNEKCYAIINGNKELIIKIDANLYRPAEVDILLGDSSKARKELNWKPNTNFNELINKMMANDIELLNN